MRVKNKEYKPHINIGTKFVRIKLQNSSSEKNLHFCKIASDTTRNFLFFKLILAVKNFPDTNVAPR